MSIKGEWREMMQRTYTQGLFCQIDIGNLDQFAAKNGDRAVVNDSVRNPWQGFHQVRETPASKDLCLQVLVALICPSASAHSQGRSKSCVLVLLDAVVVVAFGVGVRVDALYFVCVLG